MANQFEDQPQATPSFDNNEVASTPEHVFESEAWQDSREFVEHLRSKQTEFLADYMVGERDMKGTLSRVDMSLDHFMEQRAARWEDEARQQFESMPSEPKKELAKKLLRDHIEQNLDENWINEHGAALEEVLNQRVDDKYADEVLVYGRVNKQTENFFDALDVRRHADIVLGDNKSLAEIGDAVGLNVKDSEEKGKLLTALHYLAGREDESPFAPDHEAIDKVSNYLKLKKGNELNK